MNPRNALISGAIWAVAMRWSVRSIGLISTAILARQLTPQDYGVVSMAFLVVEMISAFLDTGAAAALVRIGNPSKNQINSAWTLRGLQGCGIAIVLIILTPFAATYFHEARVSNVLYVVAVCLAVMGFSNIGMTLAYKDLKYALEYKVAILTKLTAVTATLLSALAFQDYRALVFGIVFGYAMEFSLGYFMHPYRPQWDTNKIGEIWGVSKWLMLNGIGAFLLRKTDQLIAGRVGSTQEYGLYTVGADIGRLPAGEIGPSMIRPFFPILVSLKDDMVRARDVTLKTLSTVNTVIMPLGFGLAAVSEPVTFLLLGTQWSGAVPYLAGFAIISTTQFLLLPLSTLLNVDGHMKIQSYVMWIEFFIFSILSFILIPTYSLNGLVLARILSSIANLSMVIIMAKILLHISFKSILKAVLSPLFGATLMYILIWQFLPQYSTASIQLGIGILMGSTFYTTWIYLIWILRNKPDGIERTFYEKIFAQVNKK